MILKKFEGAPFDTQKARFDTSGIYPASKVPGTYTEFPHCSRAVAELSHLGPSTYHYETGDFSKKVLKEKASQPGWKEQLQMEQLSIFPHHLFKDQFMEKKLLKSKLGPGTYEFQDFLDILDKIPHNERGICDTKSSRFEPKYKGIAPGPGSYGKHGIPQTLLEEKDLKSFGTYGIIDARIPCPGTIIPPYPPPGTYEVKGGINEMLKKVVGLRGPYDIFSLKRDKPIITGHFATTKMHKLSPGEYEIPSSLNYGTSRHRKYHGRLPKGERMPEVPTERIFFSTPSQFPQNPDFPSPACYQPKQPGKSNEGISFAKEPRFSKRYTKYYIATNNPVGPGEYFRIPRGKYAGLIPPLCDSPMMKKGKHGHKKRVPSVSINQ